MTKKIPSHDAERFAELFRGHKQRYGRYDIKAGAKPEEKVDGRAQTVDQPLTGLVYEAHVNGDVGLGVIPLQGVAKEEGLVNFAALDIDVYKLEDQSRRKLTHQDIALSLMHTPLIVTRSKSGGIHVWMFSKQQVSAIKATDYLKSVAADLGVAGCEVFPKQTMRHSDGDIGNWINLPYYGGTRTAVVPAKKGDVTEFMEPTFEQFLDFAEQAAAVVTDDWLDAQTPQAKTQRGDVSEVPLWKDGPPCLQALIAGFPERVAKIKKDFAEGKINEDQMEKQIAFTRPQLGEGARNACFFNAALYLRRRLNPHDPDASMDVVEREKLSEALNEVHNQWRVETGNSGIPKELATLAKQASKGKWGYKCTEEPLKGFCKRSLCLRRKFGVGTAVTDQAINITGFTVVDTEEKQFFMTIGEKRIHIVDVATLLNQYKFAEIVLNSTLQVWAMMPQPKYLEMIADILKNADVIKAPPDVDSVAVCRNALRDFVHDKRMDVGKSDAAIFSGRVIWLEDGKHALFKFDQFSEYIKGKGYTISNSRLSALFEKLGVVSCPNRMMGGRQLRPYKVNIEALETLCDDGED